MITRLDPVANGFYTSGWTPTAGALWECVDDGASANDSDYISCLGFFNVTFAMSDIPAASASISQLVLTARMMRDGGNYDDGGAIVRSNGTDASQIWTIQGGAFGNNTYTLTTDPSGGGAWTSARINAVECGVYGRGDFSAAPDFEKDYCSWVKADVTHEIFAGGFACLVGSLAGAALGLAEMAGLARALRRKTRSLIEPKEYLTAWRDIREHRWPVSVQLGA